MLWRLLKSIMVGALGGPLLVLLMLVVMPALATGVGRFFSDLAFGPDEAAFLAEAMFLAYVIAVHIVLVLGVIIGIPVDRLMQHRGWRSAWSYIVAGALSGLPLGLLSLGLLPPLLAEKVVWWWVLGPILTCTLAGAATALVWWRGGRVPAPSGSPGE